MAEGFGGSNGGRGGYHWEGVWTVPEAGCDGFGGGGGGATWNGGVATAGADKESSAGGDGGSGVVVIRYSVMKSAGVAYEPGYEGNAGEVTFTGFVPEVALDALGNVCIKPGTTAVTYPVDAAVDAVYREICAERNAAWRPAAFDTLRERAHSLAGQRFDYKDEKDLTLHLLGAHQRKNAALAIETVGVLREKGWRIPESALREGLSAARWEARFELLRTNPPVIADGAHNPQCVEALARSLDEYLPGQKVIFLLGVLADKNYEAMLARLLPYGKKFFCLTPGSPRALSADALCACLRAKGADAAVCASAAEGAHRAVEESGGETPVVACGSLYLMGEIREAFMKA